jgi:hypothetical protein
MPDPKPRAARLGEPIGDVNSAKPDTRSIAKKGKAHASKPSAAHVAPASPPLPVHYVHRWQADGTLLSRPVQASEPPDWIGVFEAAKILRRNPRTVSRACDMGKFRTARKPGGLKQSWWKIERSEVAAMAKAIKGRFRSNQPWPSQVMARAEVWIEQP